LNVLINGSGIAGLTAAIALIKSGFSVTIFEAAPQITAAGAGLVIQPNALKALEYFGIAEQFIESANPIDQLAILNQRGRVIKEQRPSARFRNNSRDLPSTARLFTACCRVFFLMIYIAPAGRQFHSARRRTL